MPAPDSVLKLCENFAAHREHYRSSSYNETELRREFLDPLFKALGWDIDNEAGYADAYKDVIHEDAIKIGGITKAPDYCFRIGGTRKYFMEAKKPSVNIKDDISPAYQLRRYAWSGKLPLSILSDFEELAVYDCRSRPFPTDKPSKGRIFYCTFEQYAEKWDEIAAIFSREAVLKGSFDKYAEAAKGKRGTTEVDDEFLTEIERWRELIAKNLALRNQTLSQRDLNFSVQKIIDRLIFLRICEDRGSEDYERLRKRLSGKNLYPILLEEFKRADDRYNSGLFHFTTEKDRPEAPDTLTTSLSLDDKVLKDIVRNLYYPDSPYEFSVFSADILGQVYEQFLGKTIHLTAGHQAKIEEKPEVRKAGGVYYTPKYIVDYIVENTLGKILNGEPSFQAASSTGDANKPATGTAPRHPLSIAKAAEVKLLDPACGSGSFLIVAYQYLLDWHRDQYTLDPKTRLPDENKAAAHSKGKNPVIYQAAGGEWKLTIAERKRILLNSIHGVDIDSQAVEVTKLSLLLKVLEGETSTSTERDLFKERQRILPDLGDNIKCGNSLIGPDFYEQPDLPELDEETRYRINVFDWKAAFPQVFERNNPGFDCVVGNPPYIQLSMMVYYNAEMNDYLKTKFSSMMGRMNTFGYFTEEGLARLCRKEGSVSFIVPNTILTQEYYQPLRELILANKIEVLNVQLFPVFSGAVVETMVFVLRAASPPTGHRVEVVRMNHPANEGQRFTISQDSYRQTHKNAFVTTLSEETLDVVAGIQSRFSSLGADFNINQAIALKHDRAASLSTSMEDENCVPVIDGRNIGRYSITWPGEYLRYDVTNIHSCKRRDIFECDEKIFFRRVGEALTATLDTEQYFALNTLVVITPKDSATLSLRMVLGLFNSSFLNWYYSNVLKSTKKVFSEMQARQIAELPIPSIDFTSPADVAKHDKMVSLVERMLELHAKQAAEKNPNTLRMLATEITSTDRRIDHLVYELYGLTEEEKALVEA